MSLSRRAFLRRAAAAAIVVPAQHQLGSALAGAAGQRPSSGALFQHGVASGDPLTDRVVLWTRVTPPATRSATGPLDVTWEMANDEALSQVVARGTAEAAPDRDFTVKVDPGGLQPGRSYFFAFTAGGQRSSVGRTRTLPAGAVSRLRLAVVSCSNYPAGYFSAYQAIARRDDLDAVLHLGDYIYESADAVFSDSTAIGRAPLPPGEAVTLADYRLRYAVYRTDPDLQDAHRRHPFIAVWDDHEIANNAWSGGADNHDPADGEWTVRRAAAYRAYVEWLPVRETAAGVQLYRSFRAGDLADLVILDTRAFRDRQVATRAPDLNSEQRTLLGPRQESWLFDQLKVSARRGRRWRLLGQQVLFSRLVPTGPGLSMDMWDGYPAARSRVLDFLSAEQLRDVVILTGDLHSSWGLDVSANPWAAPNTPAARPLAVELVTPAISSPPLFTDPALRSQAPLLRTFAPHLKYLDGDGNGYMLLEITREQLKAEWYFTSVKQRSDRESLAATLVSERGSSRLTPA